MKPFDLETVLKYRKRLKDIAQNKFEDVKKQHRQIAVHLENTKKESSELISKLSKLQETGIDIQEHIRFETRLDFLRDKVISLKEELNKKQEIVIQERNFLIQKSKEQRVMEKLKEKQNKEWQQFLDKKEASMLDEIAVLHHKK